jgi:hypothetical protein
MAKKHKKHRRFDIRHKETLRLFLREYFELFFPDIAGRIRFETAQFLDKELTALFGDSSSGDDQQKITDALILVEAVSEGGIPEMILIHWEQEGKKKKAFEERMFHYFCGIYFRLRRPVFPIAMFTDPHVWEKPAEKTYKISLFGIPVSEYAFNVIKLKDYRAEEFEKKAAENPLAAAYLPLTDYPPEERPVIKAKAMKGIAKVEEGNRRAALYSLIEESIRLNRDERKRYRDLLQEDPVYKEEKMYESVEEIILEKGQMMQEILASEQILNLKLFSDEEDLRWMSAGQLEDILEEYRARKPFECLEEKGGVIGEIRMAQRVLKQKVSSKDELKKKSLDELKEILGELESRLSKISFH